MPTTPLGVSLCAYSANAWLQVRYSPVTASFAKVMPGMLSSRETIIWLSSAVFWASSSFRLYSTLSSLVTPRIMTSRPSSLTIVAFRLTGTVSPPKRSP